MAAASYLIRVLPELHQLACELVLEREAAGPLALTTPTWVPGAYAPMKYGRDLFELQIESGSGEALAWKREGWQGIALENAPAQVRIRWRALASDAAWGELGGIVDHEYAILRATRYLYAPSHLGPYQVRYELPEGWALHHPSGARQADLDATAFVGDGTRPVRTDATAFVGAVSRPRPTSAYEYGSFLELLELPVVCGKFERITRTIRGTTFHHVFVDRAVGFESEVGGFIDGLVRVAEEAHAVFGTFPFADYTYVFTHAPNAHWGLEHPSSTMISLGENVYIDAAARNAGVRVCAHELFHAWNVCRMKPESLVQPDFRQPPAIDTLWIAEGFTRYYEFLLGTRSKELTPEQFFSNVLNYHRHLAAMPAAARVSALDSSQASFLNHNRYPGSINASIDYYDAGMLIAFELDARLREAGDALDGRFASLYAQAMERGGAYTSEQAYRALAANEADRRGLQARVEQPLPRDGGTPEALEKLGFAVERAQVRCLGLVLAKNAGPEIAQVLDDAPAAQCGLAAGDVIDRVEGFPFALPALKWLIDHRNTLELGVLRGHRHLALRVAVGRREDLTALRWQGNAEQLQRIRDWLGRPELAWKTGEAIPLTAYDNFHGVQTVL